MPPSSIFRTAIMAMMILSVLHGSAQKQNNVWYFGDGAGLNFSTDPPQPILSPLFAEEGTATISDPEGNLLFYTNGSHLWDRTHNLMPNGSGLIGGWSSTQAALIVPWPGVDGKYFVFTSEDHFGDGDLAYSIVDMCLNNGLGDVMSFQKNIIIAESAAEKITAVLHPNRRDIWIITHEISSNRFLAFLLTETGLTLSPVSSSIGTFHPSEGMIGPLKASHGGTLLACAATFASVCDLFDFDPATGIVSNHRALNAEFGNLDFAYGIEFSPNDRILYISTCFVNNNLVQIDLQTNEAVLLHSLPGNYTFGALQLGDDGRIYLSRNNRNFLGVIQDPDLPGTNCNYVENGLTLQTGTLANLGLPNFAPYAFFNPSNFSFTLGSDTILCMGDSLLLQLKDPIPFSAEYLWNGGTTDSTLTVYESGTYWLQVSQDCIHYRDSIHVMFDQLIEEHTTIDTHFCAGATLLIDVTIPGANYLWSDMSSGPFFEAEEPGMYAVTISDFCLNHFASFFVSEIEIPQISFGDTILCDEESLVLDATIENGTYHWSDGSIDPINEISLPGEYALTVSNICGGSVTVFSIETLKTPVLRSGFDTVLCDNTEFILDVMVSDAEYLWSDNSTDPELVVSEPGVYSVQVTNDCGTAETTFTIAMENCDLDVYIPNVFSPNGDGVNDIFSPGILGMFSDYELTVYDRWGETVFHSTVYGDGWDGRFRGREMLPGVYVYMMACVDNGGLAHRYHGDVTLLR